MAAKNESDHGHDHGVTANADQRYLTGALALIVGFMAVEVIMASLPVRRH
jgi:cobalt-zinc-cadmium efflux system protein